jgi:cytosolic prostaglandin-E synthase
VQRSDSIYVTINVSDVDPKTAKVELKADRLSFKGQSGGKDYTAELEFFAEVDPEDKASKYDIKPRSIQFHIMKKNKDQEYWPRLLKDKAKEKNQVAIDWSRYCDEDEEKGGFDTSAMGQGMNFGDMGGMDDMVS